MVFGLRLANLEIKLKKILKDYQDQRQWAETWEMRKSQHSEAPTESNEVTEDVEEQLMYVRDYTSYDDMVQTLGDLVNTYPAIIDRYNQGELEGGRILLNSSVKSVPIPVL